MNLSKAVYRDRWCAYQKMNETASILWDRSLL